ncbi:MAG: hypothetical protein NTV62_01845 [Candidatus Gribaldobacteria bacterium]|nr:hypothetical protein [Candidatus Gribaldobacteria bacterium]
MIENFSNKINNVEESDKTQESLERALEIIKEKALDFVGPQKDKEWLVSALKESKHLDNIVSTMRHVNGGQKFILQELIKEAPELKWYRGGTLKRFRDVISACNHKHFEEEQLDTFVIDGGANGVLGLDKLALGFLKITARAHPVLYSVSLEGMLNGLEENAIRLVSEHGYDLCIVNGGDKLAYLKFCKEHLNIEEKMEKEVGE